MLTYAQVPVGAAFDQALTALDVRVLIAMAGHCDPKTRETDHSAVQLAQQFNTHRTVVTRCLGRLRERGYLVARGYSARHARVYHVPLQGIPEASAPSVAADAHVREDAHVAADAHVLPDAHSGPVALDAHVRLDASVPVRPDAHSLEPLRLDLSIGHSGEEADGRQVARGQYWDADLSALDFDAGTLLVQTARDLGYARDMGGSKDALQAQRELFLAAWEWGNGHPKRADMRDWLRVQAPERSELTSTPENKTALPAPAEREPEAVALDAHVPPAAPVAEDAHPLDIPDFLKRTPAPAAASPPPPPPPMPRASNDTGKPRRPKALTSNGARHLKEPWVKVLDALPWSEAQHLFDNVVLWTHEDAAFVMMPSEDRARIASHRFSGLILRTWEAQQTGTRIVIGHMCRRKKWHVMPWDHAQLQPKETTCSTN